MQHGSGEPSNEHRAAVQKPAKKMLEKKETRPRNRRNLPSWLRLKVTESLTEVTESVRQGHDQWQWQWEWEWASGPGPGRSERAGGT
eukprot:3580748-Rhodomonas_salina.1